MTKLAIDIALIPPKHINNQSIQVNQSLQDGLNKIPLNIQTHIPHITLAMGVIDANHLQEILSEVANIATRYTAFDFEFNHLYHAHLSTNEDIVGFGLSKPIAIQQLHEECMQVIHPKAIHQFDKTVLYDGEQADSITLDFIKNFPKKSTGSSFSPHITIGFGSPQQIKISPLTFRTTNLAVYQLGNYCTCQKEFATFQLENND